MPQEIFVPSDALPNFRGLLAAWPALSRNLDLPQIRAVVDTNLIIEDVRFLAKSCQKAGARTCFQETFASGVVVPYFPVEALPEIDAKLDEVSERDALAREVLGVIWQEYRTVLRICATAHVRLDDVSLRDPGQSA